MSCIVFGGMSKPLYVFFFSDLRNPKFEKFHLRMLSFASRYLINETRQSFYTIACPLNQVQALKPS